MENENERNLSKYKVLYIKGKYQYKKKYTNIALYHDIKYAGPSITMNDIWSGVKGILRKSDRITTESRVELKLLEDRATGLGSYFQRNGITHIIVYRCLDK